MDKKEFLLKLERSLSVLQEDELRDIMDEYEQHIDMKVARGLTQEEAIADFGSFEELTAELLEAYHVRADYASDGGKEKESGKAEKRYTEKGREYLGRFKKAGGSLREKDKFKDTAKKAWQKVREFFKKCCYPFAWIKRVWENSRSGSERIQRRKEGVGMGEASGIKVKAVAGGMGRAIGRLWSLGIRVILWCVRTVWNGCWILFSLVMAVCGLFALYGLRVIAVLMMQGYPLTGVLLGCIGVVLCTCSAAGLGISFLCRRREEI